MAGCRPLLRLILCVVLSAGLCAPAAAQNVYTWTGSGGGGSSTTWLTATNWTGGPAGTWPGVTGNTNAANGTANDVAVFNLTANVTVGLNMNTAGGTFTLGAISTTGTTFVPTIGNNATTFFTHTTLQLNNSGATTIAGFTNVLLNNSGTSGTMTLSSFTATNTPRMDVLLGSTTNVINITSAAAGITINSDVYEANAGSGFTLQGAGMLTLGGTGNSFTGPVTTAGAGRITVMNTTGLGTGTVSFNNTDDKSAVGAAVLTFGTAGNLVRTCGNNFVLSAAASTGFATTGNGQQDTLSGVISGGGAGLKFALAGSTAATPNSFFILTNPNNSFTATVAVGSGGVAVTSDGALGNAANPVTLSVNDATRGGLRFAADNITLAATRAVDVAANSVVDTNGFTAAIAGPVTNSGGAAAGLIKTGAGTLTLSGTNTLSTLTARQGTVVLDFTANNTNKLDPAAAVTLQGGTLQMIANPAGSSQSFASLTINQGGSSALVVTGGGGTGANLNVSNLVRSTAGGTLDFTLPAVGAVLTSAANGATGLLFDGAMTVGKTTWATVSAGTVTPFSGYTAKDDVSTFSAGDHVTNSTAFTGTLPAGGLSIASLRFNAAAAGAVTVGAGDTLTIASGTFGGILLTPAVTGVQQINGGSLTTTGTELIVHHYGTGELDIGSNITGTIGLTKSGPGRMVLSGSNTYTGATVINQGTVSVASLTGTTNLGTAAIVLGNGTLEYTGSASQSLAATRPITLAGERGPGGATIAVTDAGATLTVLGTVSGNQVSSLTKTGPGTLALNVSNAAGYFGDTVVSNGTVTATNINALGNSALTGRLILGDANTGTGNVAFLLALTSGSFPTPVTVSGQGTGTATFGVATGTAGGAVMSAEVVIARSVVLQSPASGTVQFTNRITGTGDVVINSQGTGSVNFFRAQGANVANDWAGNLVLNANSTLVIGSPAGAINVDKSIPNTANVVFNTGSALLLSPGTQLGYESVNALVSTLPTDGAITQTTGTSAFQLTVGAGNGSGTFGGVISNTAGTLSLVKAGTGTQTLTGASTYTGTTTVNGGVLAVDNTAGSGTGTGGVVVNNGGRLRGVGTIAGSVSVTGGTLAPGAATSPGTLTTSGAVTLAPAGTFLVKLGGTGAGQSDLLNLGSTGTINLGGATLTGTLVNGYVPANADTVTIISGTGATAVSGTFAQSTSVFVGTAGGFGYFADVTYNSSSVVLSNFTATPVPEPVLVFALCAAAGAIGIRVRRRRTPSLSRSEVVS
jgi:autotransporter-associated beta strand protein